jgi:hypothetical protein
MNNFPEFPTCRMFEGLDAGCYVGPVKELRNVQATTRHRSSLRTHHLAVTSGQPLTFYSTTPGKGETNTWFRPKDAAL